MTDLRELPGIGNKTAEILENSGFHNVETVALAAPGDIASVIGNSEDSCRVYVLKARKYCDDHGIHYELYDTDANVEYDIDENGLVTLNPEQEEDTKEKVELTEKQILWTLREDIIQKQYALALSRELMSTINKIKINTGDYSELYSALEIFVENVQTELLGLYEHAMEKGILVWAIDEVERE